MLGRERVPNGNDTPSRLTLPSFHEILLRAPRPTAVRAGLYLASR